VYNPVFADPAKGLFRNNVFSSDQMRFTKLWLTLAREFPGTYAESFLLGNYGYWYPGVRHNVLLFNLDDNTLGIHRAPLLPENAMKVAAIAPQKTPVLKSLYSVGFMAWLFFASIAYLVAKRKTRFIIALLPCVFLWATTLLSPVHAEYRYLYSLVLCAFPVWGLSIRESAKSSTDSPNKL
jgi:hypothetical protein